MDAVAIDRFVVGRLGDTDDGLGDVDETPTLLGRLAVEAGEEALVGVVVFRYLFNRLFDQLEGVAGVDDYLAELVHVGRHEDDLAFLVVFFADFELHAVVAEVGDFDFLVGADRFLEFEGELAVFVGDGAGGVVGDGDGGVGELLLGLDVAHNPGNRQVVVGGRAVLSGSGAESCEAEAEDSEEGMFKCFHRFLFLRSAGI